MSSNAKRMEGSHCTWRDLQRRSVRYIILAAEFTACCLLAGILHVARSSCRISSVRKTIRVNHLVPPLTLLNHNCEQQLISSPKRHKCRFVKIVTADIRTRHYDGCVRNITTLRRSTAYIAGLYVTSLHQSYRNSRRGFLWRSIPCNDSIHDV